MLEIKNLDVFYGESQALYDISLKVNEGEFVSIIGANGAGKTTIMKSIMGLIKTKKGKIFFKDRDIVSAFAWERATMGIAYVPEGRRIFPDLTVLENLKVGAYKIKDPRVIEENTQKVFTMFPRLAERKNQLANTMSGGEQQMLAIGRALMSSPDLILLDEVSMGLMPLLVDRVFQVIKEMNDEGITILLVEQNAKKALNYADRGYLLEVGRIVTSNDSEKLKEDEMIKKAYLGA
jgi:branched-chain amino acid transport system ATP-binding protein